MHPKKDQIPTDPLGTITSLCFLLACLLDFEVRGVGHSPHSTKAWRTNHSFGSMVKAKYFATEQHYRLHRPIEDIGDQESVPPDLSPNFAYSLS